MTDPATPAPARLSLQVGSVAHRRFRPKPHHLRYRLFLLDLDLDALTTLQSRVFSIDRFNLFSLRLADYGTGDAPTLKARVLALLADTGRADAVARVRLITMPRVLGYAFNPLTVYICETAAGDAVAVVYEVSNTFGERHSYVIAAEPDADGTIRQHCPKRFFVSPFLPMDLAYDFRLRTTADGFQLAIRDSDASGTVLTATLATKRHPLTDQELVKLFLRLPLMTLKVIGGIHWEALRLWLKGVPLHDRPPPPDEPASIVRTR